MLLHIYYLIIIPEKHNGKLVAQYITQNTSARKKQSYIKAKNKKKLETAWYWQTTK